MIAARRAVWIRLSQLGVSILPVGVIAAFVLWAHFGSGIPVFRSHVSSAPGWQQFRAAYGVDSFGADGYFTRAVQHGYNLFYFTHESGGRFTRKTAGDAVNSCAGCHKVEDLAYSFVNSDRFDAKLGKRMSFEERVMRCYAGPMNGFVPTLYDPAVRDIRILARAIANYLQLSEGARQEGL
jgi:cytochrome c